MSATGEVTPTVVCVLGAPRSGTSLTTHILSLNGVYLGLDDDLIQPDSRLNPAGFWEHEGIVRLNERVMESLGGSWERPPEMSPGWQGSEELSALREEAGSLVEETFVGHGLWGWKDPRNSLTLPFWQSLIPNMRYVICLRNPIDVAASGKSAIGAPAQRTYELWSKYLASALVNTSGKPRVFVSYEEYFTDWRQAVERLARFIGREGMAIRIDKLREAISDRLRHHRTTLGALACDKSVPVETAALYLLAEQLRAMAASGGGVPSGLQEAVDLYAARLM
jgi:hypothetical protein